LEDRNVVLKPEQRQAVSSLQKGKDVLTVLSAGFGKSMIFTVFGIAKRESGRSSCVLLICPLKSIVTQASCFEVMQICDVKSIGLLY